MCRQRRALSNSLLLQWTQVQMVIVCELQLQTNVDRESRHAQDLALVPLTLDANLIFRSDQMSSALPQSTLANRLVCHATVQRITDCPLALT